ncbi:MAG: hypothetical protein ACK5GN_05295 [Pseudomonadota bacterium]|jgi:hypothetical protein
MRIALIIFLIVSSSGCFTSKKQACETWLQSGEVASSYEHCIQCAQAYGTRDVRTVRECAFKKEVSHVRDGFDIR